MKKSRCFGKRGTFFSVFLILSLVASLYSAHAQEERKDESTIFLVDCSQSMVSDIHKDMESRNLLKSYTSGHDLLISLPYYNLDSYMKEPANRAIITASPLYKACQTLEKMIEDYNRGPVEIITFHEGPVDMDREGPYAKVFSGYIDPAKPESKKRILQFIDPEKYGKSRDAEMWNGILWETLKKGGGPTKINTSCKYAMNFFNKKLKKPGFKDTLKYQRLVVITDGKEMEKKSDFKKVQSLYKLESKGDWYEFREDYVVVKKEPTPVPPPPVAVTRKAKISASAGSVSGALKEDNLVAPEFKGEAALSPSLRINVKGEGDFTPKGSIAIALSVDEKDMPSPAISPKAIERKDFGKDVAIKLTYTKIKPYFGTLSKEKDVKGKINLEYKPASGEDMKKEDIPRISIPVTMKMIPSEKEVNLILPTGFLEKAAPDGVTWEMPDGKNIQEKYTITADFYKAPEDAKLEVMFLEDPPHKGLMLKKESDIARIALTPDAEKKAIFDMQVDLKRTEEKLTGVMTAKAAPSRAKAVPSKVYFSIANPVKIFKMMWKNQQKQDMAAPRSIDFGKIKIKQIKTDSYQKPQAYGFAIQPELEVFSSLNAPVEVSLEGTIIAAMGLRIEGEKPETKISDFPQNKIIALAFRDTVKPGIYSGKIVAKTTAARAEIQPSAAAGIPIQVEIQGGGYLWLIIVVIALILLIILFASKGKKQEEKPRAPVAKPEGGEQ